MIETQITVIANDIRSTHNIGSLLRTCEGFGVENVIFTGYTPYPSMPSDARLPHIAARLSKQIDKTALGAADLVKWQRVEDVTACIEDLKQRGYEIIGLEQAVDSIPLPEYKPARKVALLLGREVEGIDEALLKLCDKTVEIPMFGQKESFNVVQAAAIALYHCRIF